MCFLILVRKETAERILESQARGEEKRRKWGKSLRKFLLPCLQPQISEDQQGALQQADKHLQDGIPPSYTSLLLKKGETE